MSIDRDNYEAWLLDRLEGRLSADQERALLAFLDAHPDLREQALAMGVDLPRVQADDHSFGARDALKRALPPTGLVDRDTLDDHLVARLEGDLRPDQEQALARFLYEHPEHARDARLMDATRSQAVHTAMPHRERLEKHFPPKGDVDRARITDFLIAAQEGELDAARAARLRVMVDADPVLQREERLLRASRVEPVVVAFPAKDRLKKREGRVVPLWSFGSGAVRFAAAASVLLVLGLAWWLLRQGPAQEDRFAQRPAPAPAIVPQAARPSDAIQPSVQDTAAPEARPEVREEGSARPTAPGAKPVRGSNGKPAEVRPSAPHTAPMRPVPVEEPQEPAPLMAERPAPEHTAPQEGPEVPVSEAPPLAHAPRNAGAPARTVGELLTAGVRERVLEEPADVRPLDRNDAVALADRGLKGLTKGTGGVAVERSAHRDRFKVRLGQGLALSGSIGR